MAGVVKCIIPEIMRLLAFCVFSIAAFAQQNLSSPATVMPAYGATGELRLRTNEAAGIYYVSIKPSAGMTGNELWNLPAANVAGALTNDGSGNLSWATSAICGTNYQILYNNSGVCGASSFLTWQNSVQLLTVTGTAGNAAITVPVSAGFIESGGGFLSDVSGGAYNAFQSLNDGALLPGYGVFPAATQKGGYMDYSQVVYPPSGSTPCYDAYGNLATWPNGLTGATYATYTAWSNVTPYSQDAIVTYSGSAYYAVTANTNEVPTNPTYWAQMGGIVGAGLSDVIVWNGPSPLQGYAGGSPYHINGTPCNAPPLTNPLNGLNVSSYVFARYGFATDVSSPNAIQIFTGGAQAESYFAGALYYAGTVTHCCGTISAVEHLGGYLALNPTAGVVGGGSGCTSIASCNNPLIPGESLTEGLLYEESTTHHMTIYDSANWREVAYWNDSPTFGTVTAPEFSSTATGAAISFQTNNTCIQIDGQGDISVACTGDILNNSSTGGFSAPFNSARNVYSTAGGFESTGAGTNITFSTANSAFEVDGQGNLSLGGTGSVLAINGSTGGLNVTADTAANSIQTVGGATVYSGNPVTYQHYSSYVTGKAGNSPITPTNMGSSNWPAGMYEVRGYIDYLSNASGCTTAPQFDGGIAFNDGYITSNNGQFVIANPVTGVTLSPTFPNGTSFNNYYSILPLAFRVDGASIPSYSWDLNNTPSCATYGSYNFFISVIWVGP